MLQSKEWFQKHVHLPNKQWSNARNDKPIWFYLDITDSGAEKRYITDDDTSQVDDEDEEHKSPAT